MHDASANEYHHRLGRTSRWGHAALFKQWSKLRYYFLDLTRETEPPIPSYPRWAVGAGDREAERPDRGGGQAGQLT